MDPLASAGPKVFVAINLYTVMQNVAAYPGEGGIDLATLTGVLGFARFEASKLFPGSFESHFQLACSQRIPRKSVYVSHFFTLISARQ